MSEAVQLVDGGNPYSQLDERIDKVAESLAWLIDAENGPSLQVSIIRGLLTHATIPPELDRSYDRWVIRRSTEVLELPGIWQPVSKAQKDQLRELGDPMIYIVDRLEALDHQLTTVDSESTTVRNLSGRYDYLLRSVHLELLT